MHMFHDTLVSFAERRVITMKKKLFIPLICLTSASIITLSISYADTASSKEKNYTIEETSTESETKIESGSDENVPLKPLSDIAPNKH